MSHLRPTCPSIPVLCLLGLTGLVGLGVLGCSAAKEAKERAITEAAIGRWSCAEQDEGLTAPGTIPRFASFTLTIEPGEWTAQGDTWTNQGSWTVEGGKLTVQNDDEGIGATVTDASGGEISRDSTSLELLQRSDDAVALQALGFTHLAIETDITVMRDGYRQLLHPLRGQTSK